jgi:hypothetical protein
MPFLAIDTTQLPWEERPNEKIGRSLFRKELFTDEVMEHGASAEGDVTVVFITNKSFRIDYV